MNASKGVSKVAAIKAVSKSTTKASDNAPANATDNTFLRLLSIFRKIGHK